MKIAKSRRDEIVQLCAEMEMALTVTVKTALRIGELLTEEKEQCAHGEWGNHFEKQYSDLFSHVSASRWMRMHAQRAKFVRMTNLKDCYQLLLTDKKQPRGATKEKKAKVTNVETVTSEPAPTPEAQDTFDFGDFEKAIKKNCGKWCSIDKFLSASQDFFIEYFK